MSTSAPLSADRGGSGDAVAIASAASQAEAPRVEAVKRRKAESTFSERLLKTPIRAHPPRASVLVQPFEKLPSKSETYRSKHRHRKSLVAQIRFEKTLQLSGRTLPDWRLILQSLAESTPARGTWQTIVLKADTSNFDPEQLIHEDGAGIRTIMARTGCAIEASQTDVEDGKMSIVIYGPRASLEEAADAILAIVKSAVITDAPNTVGQKAELDLVQKQGGDDDDYRLDVEALTEHHGPNKVKHTLNFRTAQEVPKPETWNRQNFEEYVARVTDPRLGVLARSIPAQRMVHNETVAQLLREVFSSAEARSSVTLSALHRALRYCARQGPALRRDAQALFDLVAGTLKLPTSTETFNIMLAGYAKTRDLGGFDAMFRMMQAHGRVPNFRTWFTMMHMIESGELRRYMLHIMHEKGMLESPTVARRIAKLNVSHDAQIAAEQGVDLETFLASQDKLYGSRELWLTRRAGNVVVDVLCRHGRFDDAFALVDKMRGPGRPTYTRPDVVTFTTILGHAKVQRLPRVGFAAIKALDEEPKVYPNDRTYHLLFELLWQARLPLAVGVVWYYAALNAGATSYRMRRRVATVLSAMHSQDHPTTILASADGDEAVVDLLRRRRSLAALVSTLPTAQSLAETIEGHGLPLDLLFAQKYAGFVPTERLSILLEKAMKQDYEFHRCIKAAGISALGDSTISPDSETTAVLLTGNSHDGERDSQQPVPRRSPLILHLQSPSPDANGQGHTGSSLEPVAIYLEADYSSLIERRLSRKALDQKQQKGT